MRHAAVAVLILGLTLAVFTQMSYLENREGYRMHGFDGSPVRVEWAPRVASLALARAVGAENNVAGWLAGWFLLSALAWYAARGPDCVGPVALLAAGVMAVYHPLTAWGTVASEAPTVLWFTLAAITRRQAFMWWPIIGACAIPFKQSGAVLVVVAAGLWWLRGYRWHAAVLLGLGTLIGLICAKAGGDRLLGAARVTSLVGKVYAVRNIHHLNWRLPFISGGLVGAAALAARGPALAAVLLLIAAVFFMGQLREPRIWLEVVALGAGVLADRKNLVPA